MLTARTGLMDRMEINELGAPNTPACGPGGEGMPVQDLNDKSRVLYEKYLESARSAADFDKFVGQLFEATYPSLRRFVGRIGVRLPEDRDDVVLETFVRFIKRMRSLPYDFPDPEQLKIHSYLRRTASRIIIDLRRTAKHNYIELLDKHSMPTRWGSWDPNLLMDAVMRLDPDLRPIALLFIEGYRNGELAEKLDLPVRTVRDLMDRVKRRLRDLFNPTEDKRASTETNK
jgi:RNA polymerase sigma factor (sigma-70 family)